MSFDLTVFQESIRKLQKEKFPFDEDKPYRKLIGASEELGEVGHEFLRYERHLFFNNSTAKNETKHKMGMEIGDTIIFLIAFCNIVDIDISESILMAYHKVIARENAANKD